MGHSRFRSLPVRNRRVYGQIMLSPFRARLINFPTVDISCLLFEVVVFANWYGLNWKLNARIWSKKYHWNALTANDECDPCHLKPVGTYSLSLCSWTGHWINEHHFLHCVWETDLKDWKYKTAYIFSFASFIYRLFFFFSSWCASC